MTIDIPTLIEKLENPWCEACGGDGYLITIGSSSNYDAHMDAWYPAEDYDPCDECAGTGSSINNATQLGRINTHLSKLTQDEQSDLLNLYSPSNKSIRASSFQALWVFLENLELEVNEFEPAAEELLELLITCTHSRASHSSSSDQQATSL